MEMQDEHYRRLLDFRDGLRVFLRWSEGQAKAAGLTPAQHQLLLAVRGHGGAPSIRELADHLLVRHHSVVELVDRAEGAGLVGRFADTADRRVTRIRLTADGRRRVGLLAVAHLEELSRLRVHLDALWADLPGASDSSTSTSPPWSAPPKIRGTSESSSDLAVD